MKDLLNLFNQQRTVPDFDAIKIALAFSLQNLLGELTLLADAFAAKGREFAHIVKVGRTQLQDAVPMTLGQEFHGFATTLGEDYNRLTENAYLLFEINMGATAIGTGSCPAMIPRPLSRRIAFLRLLILIVPLLGWAGTSACCAPVNLFGALPLVLTRGDGAELRQPLGITIAGGLVMSQLLTLYTTPVVYLYFDRLQAKFRRNKQLAPLPH